MFLISTVVACFSVQISRFDIFHSASLFFEEENLCQFFGEGLSSLFVDFLRSAFVHSVQSSLPCEIVVCLKLRVPSNSHVSNICFVSLFDLTVPPLLINLRENLICFQSK